MKRKTARRFPARPALLIALIVLIALLIFIRAYLLPQAGKIAAAQASGCASAAARQAIERALLADAVDDCRMIDLEKDASGSITAVHTNIAELNRLKMCVLTDLEQQLWKMDNEALGVPLGDLILPEFFAGRGPRLPVRLLSVRSLRADFHSAFSPSGLGQTLHQIVMEISADLTLVTPAGTREANNISRAVVAETVLIDRKTDQTPLLPCR